MQISSKICFAAMPDLNRVRPLGYIEQGLDPLVTKLKIGRRCGSARHAMKPGDLVSDTTALGPESRRLRRRAAPSPLPGHGPGVLRGNPPLEDFGSLITPPGGRFCSVGHPNLGGRGGTIKCLRRPLERPPEGGRGPLVCTGWVGRVGARPDLPVIPAKAGIHWGTSKVGPRFRGDDRCGGRGSRGEPRPTGSSGPSSPSPSGTAPDPCRSGHGWRGP